MKKELFVGAFLLLMLAAAFINIYFLNKLTDKISVRIDDAITDVEKDNWSDAEKKAEQAVKMWRESDSYTHLVLRHSEVESATDALYGFAQQIYAHDAGGAKGAGASAKARVQSISEIERVHFGSIF